MVALLKTTRNLTIASQPAKFDQPKSGQLDRTRLPASFLILTRRAKRDSTKSLAFLPSMCFTCLRRTAKNAVKALRFIIAVILLVSAGRLGSANAQTETILHLFAGYPTDGSQPDAALVQGRDGNFYGTTQGGTTSELGTVFRVSPSGTYTSLYWFTGCDGYLPNGLVQGSDGNFYGTTVYGGNAEGGGVCGGSGSGTVFRISSSGNFTSLYSFGSSPNDGRTPNGLVQGSDGDFYGATLYGGTYGSGTVFRISPSGSYTNLYSFGSYPGDGQIPQGGLVQGSDGNFYGTTVYAGTSTNCPGSEFEGIPSGCGTVFRINPNGSYTNLYSFGRQPTDGANPSGRLVQGSDGNFYGTAGTVFRISPGGSETTLYRFLGSPDGAIAQGGLVQGSDGNFYGTTVYGGTNLNYGTLFRISPSGSETVLYSFAGPPTDGQYPTAGLVQGSDGSFYGTTPWGGTNINYYCDNGCGTVFKLTVPLNPPPYPINQITGAHLAATNIILAVSSIAGETYQLQFSSSMNPTNWVNVSGVSVTNSIGALLTLTNFAGALLPHGFYRFAITP
jgi:uncharacterized repeat protein (TIGR03803 family)